MQDGLASRVSPITSCAPGDKGMASTSVNCAVPSVIGEMSFAVWLLLVATGLGWPSTGLVTRWPEVLNQLHAADHTRRRSLC